MLADTDDCSPDPCAYGACIDCVNTFTCNCEAGYTGRLCDTSEYNVSVIMVRAPRL